MNVALRIAEMFQMAREDGVPLAVFVEEIKKSKEKAKEDNKSLDFPTTVQSSLSDFPSAAFCFRLLYCLYISRRTS